MPIVIASHRPGRRRAAGRCSARPACWPGWRSSAPWWRSRSRCSAGWRTWPPAAGRDSSRSGPAGAARSARAASRAGASGPIGEGGPGLVGVGGPAPPYRRSWSSGPRYARDSDVHASPLLHDRREWATLAAQRVVTVTSPLSGAPQVMRAGRVGGHPYVQLAAVGRRVHPVRAGRNRETTLPLSASRADVGRGSRSA